MVPLINHLEFHHPDTNSHFKFHFKLFCKRNYVSYKSNKCGGEHRISLNQLNICVFIDYLTCFPIKKLSTHKSGSPLSSCDGYNFHHKCSSRHMPRKCLPSADFKLEPLFGPWNMFYAACWQEPWQPHGWVPHLTDPDFRTAAVVAPGTEALQREANYNR